MMIVIIVIDVIMIITIILTTLNLIWGPCHHHHDFVVGMELFHRKSKLLPGETDIACQVTLISTITYDKRDADCDDLRNLGIVENIQNYMPVLPSPGLVRQVFCCTVQCSSITMKVASL